MKYEFIDAEERAIELTAAALSRSWMRESPDMWYVLRVEPQKEFTVETILGNMGLVARVPYSEKWIKNSRKHRDKRVVKRPLLRTHIFVHLPVKINWFHIKAVKLITGVLCNPNPIRLSTEAIDEFSRMGKRIKQYQEHQPTNLNYEVGDRVEVLDGPLEGFKVDVKSIKGMTATVVFDIMQAQRKVEIDAANLGKI